MTAMPAKAGAWLWSPDWRDKPFFVFWPVALLRLLVAVVRDLREGRLRLYATSLVYTTFLSFAPLLAICFSVLKGFGAHNQIEPFLRSFLEPLGKQGAVIATRIVGFVDNIQVGVLGAVGVGLLVYSVISLMHKIESAFNDIWRVPTARSLTLRVRDYLGVLLIGPLFLFLSVGMTASLRHAAAVQSWFGVDLVGTALERIFETVPYLLFMLAFAALYMFMPNTRVRLLPALAAGAATGALWKLLGKAFGVFVAGSTGYAAVYSAFAALIVFMIWIYAGWLVVLAGSSLCYYLQNPSNQPLPRNFDRLSQAMREKIALQMVAEAGKSFYRDQKGLTLAQLAQRLGVPALAIEGIAEDLVHAGIFAPTGRWAVEFIPGRPFDETPVILALSALRGGHSSLPGLGGLKPSPVIGNILRAAEVAQEQALSGVTLKQLALEEGKA